jgi:hypothetical protein
MRNKVKEGRRHLATIVVCGACGKDERRDVETMWERE